MLDFAKRLLPLMLLVCTGSALAQQPRTQPVLNLGNAVVTGFSGTVTQRSGQKSATDTSSIDPDGPSVRVIDVSRPGDLWDGRMFAAPKTFSASAKDVGQVFGVALDDARNPNIYVAATSAFGLNIITRSRNGSFERRKKGAPGAVWMRGQFGLELQGGPGAIYKIDGQTGAVTLFANVTLDGVPNPAPGLGNLAYDAAHKQLFVSDLYTGMIHRFDLDGRDLGRFDHGVTARTAANQPPIAFDPARRPNIASDRFDSEKPDSWGLAPLPRRVWGLAVHDDRLYYSVAAGPQIWSVGIARDGNFANDPRWELDIPASAGTLPVSDIAFSQQGAMLLAQRAPSTGAYDHTALTQAGEPRVLRIRLKGPNDPPSPGRWKPEAEEYAVGFANNSRNTNGGVALGYGYGPDATLNTGACESSLWTTGQSLRNAPALREQLQPGGPLVVHGLQASPSPVVRNLNDPPWASYYVRYGDRDDDARASGLLGSVRIFTQPCASPVAYAQPIASLIAMPFCVGPNCRNACKPLCMCPPGTVLDGKECVKSDVCPAPKVPGPIPGVCICPPGTIDVGGECVPHALKSGFAPGGGTNTTPIECKPPMVPGPIIDTCICPQGTALRGGQCVAQACTAPLVAGSCYCPQGTVQDDGTCVAPIDVGIAKTGATTPVQEPFYVFDITVTNNGIALSGSGNITVTDTVPANMTFNTIGGGGWTCLPTSGGAGTVISCTYPANGVTAGQVLPVIHVDATATGTAPYPPVTECASVSVAGDSVASNNNACVTVTKPDRTGELLFVKNVVYLGPILLPAQPYPVDVTCGTTVTLNLLNGITQTAFSSVPYNTQCTFNEPTPPVPPNVCPPNWTGTWVTTYSDTSPITINQVTKTVTVTNTLTCKPGSQGDTASVQFTKTIVNDTSANLTGVTFPATATCGGISSPVTLSTAAPAVVGNLAVGTSCSVSEPLPIAPTAGCDGGFPAWLPATYSTPSVNAANGSPPPINVTNTLRCERGGYVGVLKLVTNNTQADISGLTYPATLTCSVGSPISLTLTAGIPELRHNFPINTTCSASETLPPPPTTGCPAGQVPAWGLQTSTPASVTVAAGAGPIITIQNVLNCTPQPAGMPATCDPNTTVAKEGMCSCRYDGMHKTSPTMCMCNVSGTFEPGKGCAKEKQIVCVEPAKLNKRGDGCFCPRGYTLKGNTCVKNPKREPKEEKKRGVTPGDVIQVLPGLIPGIGGRGGHSGGGGGGGGGGAGGGKR